jgi:hypothetical protein
VFSIRSPPRLFTEDRIPPPLSGVVRGDEKETKRLGYNWSTKESQSYITTDGQSASLCWCQATIRARDQFFFLLEIFFRQLRVCYFVAPSLSRGRVCNSLLLLVSPAQSRSGLSPEGLKTIFDCSNSWDFLNLKCQVPVFISPRNRVAQTYARALLSVASYDSQIYGGGILSRLNTGNNWVTLFLGDIYIYIYTQGPGPLEWDSLGWGRFWATLTSEWLRCKLQTCPLVMRELPTLRSKKLSD